MFFEQVYFKYFIFLDEVGTKFYIIIDGLVSVCIKFKDEE